MHVFARKYIINHNDLQYRQPRRPPVIGCLNSGKVPTKGQGIRSKLLGPAGLERGPSPEYYISFCLLGLHYIRRLYKLKSLKPSPIYPAAESRHFFFSEKKYLPVPPLLKGVPKFFFSRAPKELLAALLPNMTT